MSSTCKGKENTSVLRIVQINIFSTRSSDVYLPKRRLSAKDELRKWRQKPSLFLLFQWFFSQFFANWGKKQTNKKNLRRSWCIDANFWKSWLSKRFVTADERISSTSSEVHQSWRSGWRSTTTQAKHLNFFRPTSRFCSCCTEAEPVRAVSYHNYTSGLNFSRNATKAIRTIFKKKKSDNWCFEIAPTKEHAQQVRFVSMTWSHNTIMWQGGGQLSREGVSPVGEWWWWGGPAGWQRRHVHDSIRPSRLRRARPQNRKLLRQFPVSLVRSKEVTNLPDFDLPDKVCCPSYCCYSAHLSRYCQCCLKPFQYSIHHCLHCASHFQCFCSHILITRETSHSPAWMCPWILPNSAWFAALSVQQYSFWAAHWKDCQYCCATAAANQRCPTVCPVLLVGWMLPHCCCRIDVSRCRLSVTGSCFPPLSTTSGNSGPRYPERSQNLQSTFWQNDLCFVFSDPANIKFNKTNRRRKPDLPPCPWENEDVHFLSSYLWKVNVDEIQTCSKGTQWQQFAFG